MTVTRTEEIEIHKDSDVAIARIRTLRLAQAEGFTEVAATAVATAVSELARNALVHAGSGEVHLAMTEDERGRRGIVIVVRDHGPGIANIERSMSDGYSTKTGSLGLGMPSAQRL